LTTDHATRYQARLRQVLEHIDAHLEQDLSVEALSGVAAFSKFHFHRQFSELLGLGVYQYVQLRRLKRAAYRLAFRADQPVIEIALASGYEGPEAFARAFKKALGQSPSAFRKEPDWEPWSAHLQPLLDLRNQHMQPNFTTAMVRIVDFPATRVAAYEHRGDPRLLGQSIRRFIEWRKQHRLPPKVSATFNILWDNPETTPPEEFRLDLCAATRMEMAPGEDDMVARTLPGGRCAVLRHTGSDETLGAAVKYLYAQWLPQSGEELRDFPAFVQRVSFFPDVPENEAVSDVFLPLAR
jgi:AraC family transcriptional regulator